MAQYINGEFYRLIHKKSLYIYFGAVAVIYFIVAYIRSGGFTPDSVISDAISFFNLLPALAGGVVFAAVYTDDLNSKNLISLVGFGLSKAKIAVSKLILMILICAAVFGLAPAFHCGVYGLFGFAAAAGDWAVVYAIALKFYLMAVAFAALSGVAVYGAQRATFAVVLFILLAFNIISGLLAAVLNSFAPGLIKFFISGISDRIIAGAAGGGFMIAPVIEYIIYVAAATALSIFIFYKKEMEF